MIELYEYFFGSLLGAELTQVVLIGRAGGADDACATRAGALDRGDADTGM